MLIHNNNTTKFITNYKIIHSLMYSDLAVNFIYYIHFNIVILENNLTCAYII